jgi:two-component system chemotaxis response regulator CheB
MGPIILIAASAGGIGPLRQIVAALPVPCEASVFVVQHIGANLSRLPALLASTAGLPAIHAHDNALIETGHIYVAPPDHHMLLEFGRVRLNRGPKVHYTRPAADPLFISAAEVYGDHVIGIVLSGGDGDGAGGLRAVTEHGGLAFVQHPDSAWADSMPRSAIAAGNPTVLTVTEIAHRVRILIRAMAPLRSGPTARTQGSVLSTDLRGRILAGGSER